jgi:carbon monoxide dehydrogenase subunit G
MATIESKKVSVPSSAEQVFTFLSNTDNIYALLPQSKVTDWKSDGTTCSFKVQGSYNIGLRLKASTPHSKIVFESVEGSPFAFTLEVNMNESNGQTEVQQVCEASLNPFLEMIVKGPLKSLFDYMADKLVTEVK